MSDEAMDDVHGLFLFISENYKAPITAKNYIDGLFEELDALSNYAGSLALYTNLNLQKKYGYRIKRTNYKKIAIIFIVENQTVFVVRILPASSIIE